MVSLRCSSEKTKTKATVSGKDTPKIHKVAILFPGTKCVDIIGKKRPKNKYSNAFNKTLKKT